MNDTATSDSGNRGTRRPRVLPQLKRIDLGLAGFALTVAGILITIFPDLHWTLKAVMVILVVYLWLWSVVGLARDKAQLEQRIQLLEDPVKAYNLKTVRLTELLTARKTEMEAAEKTLVAVEREIDLYSYRPDTDPRKMTEQNKIDRAREHFNKARDMCDRANQRLQEHMEEDPHSPNRIDGLKSDALESTVD